MNTIFDNIIELPNKAIKERADGLIGFTDKFNRVFGNLRLLIDSEGLKEWSLRHHGVELAAVSMLADRHPLVILAGDVGTGKTVSAEAIADHAVRELDREGFFLRLSTRVRGEGLHGQMGGLVNDAFAQLKEQVGKKRVAFLLIDEADAIASSRSTLQMHQEEKAAVNTLIQKIDEVREMKGRAVIFMSTNRLDFLDEAIVRRAAVVVQFTRPSLEERIELFAKFLNGAELSESEIADLAKRTGPESNGGLGYTFSDLTLRVIPEAIAACFPDNKLSYSALIDTIKKVAPSPEIK
ncbi:MAG TPA: AAA family ATPase [Pyrinomonadaceae bacterium]|nr:AAA family ATPase [Pyrinomonadaceae bacterium]